MVAWKAVVCLLLVAAAAIAVAQNATNANVQHQGERTAVTGIDWLDRPDLIAERNGVRASLWFVTKQVRDQFFSLPSEGESVARGNGGRPDVAILELHDPSGKIVSGIASIEMRLAKQGDQTWTTVLFPSQTVYSGELGVRDAGQYKVIVEFVLDGEPHVILFPQLVTIQ
jgi:hypothetical protein